MSFSAESQLNRLDAAVSGVLANLEDCLTLLVSPDGLPRFVVAERLEPLGSALIPYLIELVADPIADDDLRHHAALLGFAVGDRGSCAIALLDLVEDGGSLAIPAANRLANASHPGTATAIERGLRHIDRSSIDTIVGLLHAYRSTGGHLPADLRADLASNENWQVTSAMNEMISDPTKPS